jgi:SAM-dependent methyltransferase
MTTATATQYWETRHETAEPGWAERYWRDVDAPHRDALVDAVAELYPFRSLLEVGCNAGPNLRRFAARWPDVTYHGLDPNAQALAMAYTHGVPAYLKVGAVPIALSMLPVVDVVVTCYTLAYVAPEDLPRTLAGLWAKASRGMVLAEPMVVGDSVIVGDGPEWAHDYATEITRQGWPLARFVRRPVPRADRLDSLLLLEAA